MLVRPLLSIAALLLLTASGVAQSTVAGVVSDRPVSAGDVVQPGMGLFTVVDPGSMRLDAAVPADQLGSVHVGAPVFFSVNGYPGRSFQGKVARINPAADPATGQVPIYVTIPNTGGTLVGGLYAQGRVAAETRRGIIVPTTAVSDDGNAPPTVLRIKGGRVESVTVQVGLRDEQAETVELIAGLTPGDTLLVGAAQGITPGTPVRVQTIKAEFEEAQKRAAQLTKKPVLPGDLGARAKHD